MNVRHLLSAATAATLLAATSGAHAQDGKVSGIYFGLGGGISNLDQDRGDIAAAAASAGVAGNVTALDDDDVGWKVYGGYQFNRHFAVEGGYVDLGEASASFAVTAPTAATLGVEAEASGFELAVVGSVPLGRRFSLDAKAGLFVWDVNGTATAVVGAASARVDADDDGTGLVAGVGARYRLTDHVAVRVEWERFNDVSDSDVDLFSGSILYRF